MKIKGVILIVLGILGAIFISIYDIITGKSVNDLSGPKSIFGLISCGIIVVLGIISLARKNKKKTQESSKAE